MQGDGNSGTFTSFQTTPLMCARNGNVLNLGPARIIAGLSQIINDFNEDEIKKFSYLIWQDSVDELRKFTKEVNNNASPLSAPGEIQLIAYFPLARLHLFINPNCTVRDFILYIYEPLQPDTDPGGRSIRLQISGSINGATGRLTLKSRGTGFAPAQNRREDLAFTATLRCAEELETILRDLVSLEFADDYNKGRVPTYNALSEFRRR